MSVFHPVQETPVENRRKFSRLHTMLTAQFFLDPEMGWQECLIFNISCNGMAIQFHACEALAVGSAIYLEVYSTDCSKAMHFRGVMRWIEKIDNNYIGGIELLTKLEEEKLANLI